jgi:hypothetical protein
VTADIVCAVCARGAAALDEVVQLGDAAYLCFACLEDVYAIVQAGPGNVYKLSGPASTTPAARQRAGAIARPMAKVLHLLPG